MEFKKFTSIENVQRQKWIDAVIDQGHGGKQFVVTEKIHGANCGRYYDGKTFKLASRSQFLAPDSNFYGISNHYDELKEKTIKAYELLGGDGFIIIYGEWFGGRYTGMVSPAGTKQVQRECLYTPFNEFCGFDLVKDGEVLNVYDRNEILEKSGIYFAKPLFIGTFQECLEYPNDFVTKVPADFNLPEIEGNITEGTVIVPVEPLFFANGSRIIFKNKNEKFKENKGGKKPKVKEDVQLSDEGLDLLNILLGYVNDNRRNAVVSKFENITDKSFGPLMGAYMRDIVDDYRKDFEKEIGEGLDEKEEKKIKKELSKAVQLDIHENFTEILDRFNY